MAYGQVQLEPEVEGEGEYVVPDELAISSHDQRDYEQSPVGRHSNLYDIPTGHGQPVSQAVSPQTVVYAVPHETNGELTQSPEDT